MDQRLTEYIRKHIELGHHPEKIKRVLLNSGWNAEVIEAHLKHALGFKPKKSFADSIKRESSSNSEKYFIIGLIVVFVVVILFMGLNYFFDFGSRNDDKKETAIAGNFEPDENTQDLLNRALISNDPAICNQIMDNAVREECKKIFFRNETACDEKCEDSKIFNLAIINNNESLCAGIINESSRQNCFSFFNMALFVNKTEEVCNQECKDKESLNSALIRHNESICLEINNSLMKDQCTQIFSKRDDKI